MKKLLLILTVLFTCKVNAQTNYLLQPASINRLLSLLNQQDSIQLFITGSLEKNQNGDSCYRSTLPEMNQYNIYIKQKTGSANYYSFIIQIPTPKSTTFPRLRAELRLLIRAKALNYNMQPGDDNEYQIICNGENNTQLRLLYNDVTKISTLYIMQQ